MWRREVFYLRDLGVAEKKLHMRPIDGFGVSRWQFLQEDFIACWLRDICT